MAAKYIDEIPMKFTNIPISLQDTSKFIQIDIFGLKIYNLATLLSFETGSNLRR
jgi:hypothetical protein